MKKALTTLLLFVALAWTAVAQSPQGFSYQAVVRDEFGKLLVNGRIDIEITIHKGSSTGLIVYRQRHNGISTNGNGLFTLTVGENSNDFANIAWSEGPYYLNSEITLPSASEPLYTSQKIMSVPYALHAQQADRLSDTASLNENDPIFRSWGYDYNRLINTPHNLSEFNNDPQYVTNSALNISLNGDTLSLNNGRYVILPTQHEMGPIYWSNIVDHPTNVSQFANDAGYVTENEIGLNTVVANNSNANGRITNLHNPVNQADAANKRYVDDIEAALEQRIDSLAHATPSGIGLNNVVAYNNNAYGRISSLSDPITPNDATNKNYVDAKNIILNNRIDSLANVTTNGIGLNTVVAVNSNANGRITNLSTPITQMDAANKEYVDVNDNHLEGRIDSLAIVTASGVGLNAVVANNSNADGRITNLWMPINSTDATNKNYVDSNDSLLAGRIDSLSNVTTSGIGLNTVVANNSNADGRITNLWNPINSTDATNKKYVDNNDSLLTIRIDSLSAITTSGIGLNTVVANNSNADGRITNLWNPINSTDATNKDYVDSNDNLLVERIDSLKHSNQELYERIDSLTTHIAMIEYRLDSLAAIMRDSVKYKSDSLVERIYILEHPQQVGALNGIFSVSETVKVQFSRGNLQYKPYATTWRFASKQYDYAGLRNQNVTQGEGYSEWIDLFGFGTSGWKGDILTQNYLPYHFSPVDASYINQNLTDESVNGDWGYYNAILNGGNQTGIWRVLTNTEWDYLLNNRESANTLKGNATVCSVRGYILLPDNWENTLPFTPNATDYQTNTYTESQWEEMEAKGAVFLPCAGTREVSTVNDLNAIGKYWTSIKDAGDKAYTFSILQSSTTVSHDVSLHTGCSVRLVRIY